MLAIPAHGQARDRRFDTETGTRIPVRESRVDTAVMVRDVLSIYGECVVRKHPAEARVYVLLPPDEIKKGNDVRRWHNLADEDCFYYARKAEYDTAVGLKMTFAEDSLRYTLADALVSREFAAAPVIDPKSVPRLSQAMIEPAQTQANPSKRPSDKELASLAEARMSEMRRAYLSEFGECVVRADPANARALLASKVDSLAESGIFTSLGPALGGCVVAGRKFTLGKSVVRGTIAYNYYRLASAASPNLGKPK
jgi:hypothetical protein